MKKIIKFFLGILVLPTIVAGILYSLDKNGFFNITELDIAVENSVAQPQYLQPFVQELDKYLETYRGASLWGLEMNQLAADLSKYSWIEEISLARRWPSKLLVSIRAKDVKMILLTKQGKLLPIVSNGQALEPVEIKQAPDVAILRGEVFEKKPELRKSAIQVIDQIPYEGAFSQKTISEIRYDEKDGFWMTMIKDGIQVKLGHDQVALKSARVGQVMEYMNSRKQNAQVIDANLSKKVLVRLKSDQ